MVIYTLTYAGVVFSCNNTLVLLTALLGHKMLIKSCKQAKRKRISELSMTNLPMENRRKTQWDFVLEEMSWLANDFAQV